MPLPAELLLPLFVLTLFANAILVGVAIRGIIRGQYDPDRHRGGSSRRPDIGRAGPAGGRNGNRQPAAPGPAPDDVQTLVEAGPAAAPSPGASSPPVAPEPPPDAPSPVETNAVDIVTTPKGAGPDLPADSGPRPKRRRTTKSAAPVIPAIKPPRAEPRRGRRRFSLPPLDDDHERVSRSIESFLSGGDPTAESAETTEAVPTPGVTDGATTVAIVVVDGLPDGWTDGTPRRTGRPPRRVSEPDPMADALAMVERTLCGFARGTDVVTVGDHGRFQIVLASTGELAARAYLRRIRAAIEPRLETSDQALHLVVATATVLDEPAEAAVQRAEHRLAIALGATRSVRVEPPADASTSDDDADDEDTAPRAAAD